MKYTNTANSHATAEDMVTCLNCGEEIELGSMIASVHGTVCLPCDIILDAEEDESDD